MSIFSLKAKSMDLYPYNGYKKLTERFGQVVDSLARSECTDLLPLHQKLRIAPFNFAVEFSGGWMAYFISSRACWPKTCEK